MITFPAHAFFSYKARFNLWGSKELRMLTPRIKLNDGISASCFHGD